MRFAVLLSLMFIVVPAFAARKADDNISQAEASARKLQVKSVEYDLHFDLAKKADGFKGQSKILVELSRTDLSLTLDSMVKKINFLKVNGKELKNYVKRKGSLDIPAKYLSPKTEIEISFSSNYGKKAGGFIRSIDPKDGSEYIYTDFEPYYAHNLFPSFDQPDLKANFKVTVSAPSDWKVIQNELVESTKVEGDQTTTTFKKTPLISTYLFFLGAGPFHEWTDSFDDLPLHLYARKSLADFVDAERIFQTTKAGLKFFNDYFGYTYPFSKYGQLFIPEFAWGGMENPGAVTLNERNIFRGPVPDSQMAKRDSLILHEMAHMWFGDLVTMEWWNDLWLNESFATYLASVALERAMDVEATWISFMNTKAWGYWQDQLVTTHPIETDVPDVRTAKGNFDGITYAKGASALKQLHFYVGEKGFREGLRSYFKTFAFKNTQRKDFIDSIAKASNKNLDDWTKQWLQTAGPNKIKFEYSCTDKKISSAVLKQSKSVSGALSPHRTKLGFYEHDDGELDIYKVIKVTITDEQSDVKDAIGVDCPDFVLPDLEDKDYGIYSLDKKSIALAPVALIGLDSLSRYMVWETLHEMIRSGELKPLDFYNMALPALEVEEDDMLLGFLMGRRSNLRSDYQLYLSKEARAILAPKLEAVLLSRIMKAKPGSSLQMAFYDFFVSIASTKSSMELLHTYLTKNTPPKGITLDQDRRWAIIIALSQNGHSDAMTLKSEEVKKDSSTMGKRMSLAAEAAWPDPKSKTNMWKTLLTKELTYSDFAEAAHYIHNDDRPELSASHLDEYFKKVTSMDWKSNDDIVDIYFEQLFPYELCSKEVESLSAKKLNSAKNLTSIAKRSWLEAQDELSRCVRVRRLEKL